MKRLAIILLLILLHSTTFGQKTIQGLVTSTDGQPVSGVKIATSDRNLKTKTNKQGEYEITLPAMTELVFRQRDLCRKKLS